MAFQIFRRASGDAAAQKARAGDSGVQTQPNDASLGQDFAPNARATGIDVEENSIALSGALQTAALLFANKQIKPAAQTLQEALVAEDAKVMFSWLAYLDLLRRAKDRAGFDETALKYVVAFERSAPSWDEISTDAPHTNAAAVQQAASLTFPAALRGEKPPAVTALLTQAKKPKTPDARLSVDARELQEIDAEAATALAGALTSVRRQGWPVEWTGLQALNDVVWKPLRAGEAKMRERWFLGLELLIWMMRERDFEDRAVDFAITFEQSPPSWEKSTPDQQKWAAGGAKATAKTELSLTPLDAATEIGSAVQKIEWVGEMAGPNDVQLARLLTPTQKTERVEINMAALTHIDFVCAGAVTNGIVRVMASGRDVYLRGASPILRALLQITGVPENLFVQRKRA